MLLCPRFDAVSLGRQTPLALPSERPSVDLSHKISYSRNDKHLRGWLNQMTNPWVSLNWYLHCWSRWLIGTPSSGVRRQSERNLLMWTINKALFWLVVIWQAGVGGGFAWSLESGRWKSPKEGKGAPAGGFNFFAPIQHVGFNSLSNI